MPQTGSTMTVLAGLAHCQGTETLYVLITWPAEITNNFKRFHGLQRIFMTKHILIMES